MLLSLTYENLIFQANNEYDNAKPYKSIPGPSPIQMIRLFMPGGSTPLIMYIAD